MALITDIVADHFRAGDDAASLVFNLDVGIHSAGIAARMIRDMALHGTPGGGTAADPEEIAAAATGLLAHLGQLGLVVDQLEAFNEARLAPVAGSRGRD